MANVSPDSPVAEQPVIGIIGRGEIGRMYAKHLSATGWKKSHVIQPMYSVIYVCDRKEKYEQLQVDIKDLPGVTVLKNGHLVSRCSDFIMYSVEAEFIDRVVAEYGPSTKVGAFVSGQTSVKDPERQAFEKHLPNDVHIVSIHSLHGPALAPEGQPLCIIQHRAPDSARILVETILAPFKSHYVYLSYEAHDLITANAQAVTHAAFLSMGTAWNCAGYFPWEEGTCVRGIETVKVNIMLRIYCNKWHVYAGLAILNPSAKVQIHQFAQSATALFKLMIEGDEDGLRKRVYRARDIVFDDEYREGIQKKPIILSEKMLDQFSLARKTTGEASTTDDDASTASSNSHLAL
ncbi:prephenate dehydrogenase (NADP(+)) [Tulasnella sp. 417]|nr:prephenate dehydrogenase (NADP(+)) [Tulasnella sp. 417]